MAGGRRDNDPETAGVDRPGPGESAHPGRGGWCSPQTRLQSVQRAVNLGLIVPLLVGREENVRREAEAIGWEALAGLLC
jgi:hypothetical protein